MGTFFFSKMVTYIHKMGGKNMKDLKGSYVTCKIYKYKEYRTFLQLHLVFFLDNYNMVLTPQLEPFFLSRLPNILFPAN